MKELGEKLKKTREALGFSVRDAADATHLRADVIENMEAGEFNFNLPDIYKRGFLRIYAAFLKLDEAATVAEYENAVKAANKMDEKKRNIFSRVAGGELDETSASANRFDSYDDAPDSDSENSEDGVDTSKYLKIGGIAVGALLAVVVIVMVCSSIFNSAPETNADLVDEETAALEAATSGELVLAVSALGDTYIVVMPSAANSEPIFKGMLLAGEKKVYTSAVPLKLQVAQVENIKLSKNGRDVELKGLSGFRQLNVSLPKPAAQAKPAGAK